MSLAPGDPTLWNGVIFVRSGEFKFTIPSAMRRLTPVCRSLCFGRPPIPAPLPRHLSRPSSSSHLRDGLVPPIDCASYYIYL